MSYIIRAKGRNGSDPTHWVKNGVNFVTGRETTERFEQMTRLLNAQVSPNLWEIISVTEAEVTAASALVYAQERIDTKAARDAELIIFNEGKAALRVIWISDGLTAVQADAVLSRIK